MYNLKYMHSSIARQQAVKLREAGHTYAYIMEKTGFSKSTLSGWLSDIVYTPNETTLRRLGRARAAASARKAHIKSQSLEQIQRNAIKDIAKITKRDLFMFGLGLYLGEGGKTNDIVRISSSDPRIIQIGIAWFESLGVVKDQFAPRIHLYPDSDVQKSLQFWSQTTSIPISQFHKSQIDVRTGKKQSKKGRLPHGTLHLGVRGGGRKEFGVAFARRIHAWNDEVSKRIQAGLV